MQTCNVVFVIGSSPTMPVASVRDMVSRTPPRGRNRAPEEMTEDYGESLVLESPKH